MTVIMHIIDVQCILISLNNCNQIPVEGNLFEGMTIILTRLNSNSKFQRDWD